MKVAFLGNHTVGLVALQTLHQIAEVVAVVAHPADPEDGARYASVYDWAMQQSLPVYRGKPSDAGIARLLADAHPDLLWVTDYRYLLPTTLWQAAPLGAINLHPSLLPAYRGRAPLNWALIHGETEVGLTAHYIAEAMDAGDVVAQVRIPVGPDDDIGTVLDALMPHYAALPRQIVSSIEAGTLSRRPQDHALATSFPRRTPDDGRISWQASARAVHNLVRAVTAPYPGAFSFLGDTPVHVWRTQVSTRQPDVGTQPGTIVLVDAEGPHVACGPSDNPEAIVLRHVTVAGATVDAGTWQVGAHFS